MRTSYEELQSIKKEMKEEFDKKCQVYKLMLARHQRAQGIIQKEKER